MDIHYSQKFVHCEEIAKGPDMPYKPNIEEGQAMRCEKHTFFVYRFTKNGVMRLYPDPKIASSWDSNWEDSAKTVNCAGIMRGTDMPYKPNVEDGQTIRCTTDTGELYYRYTNGERRWYPKPEITSSWDPNWDTGSKVIDCKGITKGPDMPHKPEVKEGKTIKCHYFDELHFRYTDGELRLYPNPTIASSWDPNWHTDWIVINCDGFIKSSSMIYRVDQDKCQLDTSKISDTLCDGGLYNTEECGWDGGDCVDFNDKYPDCKVDHPSWIGSGFCRGGEYNTEECGWDGGDCEDFNEKYPDCTAVDIYLIGNTVCNGGKYNTEECGWDGGDCEAFNENSSDCKVYLPFLIGNGYCQGGEYNTEECGWDGGDCEDFNEKYPDCKVDYPSYVGDRYCQGGEYNTEGCGWDGGDCL